VVSVWIGTSEHTGGSDRHCADVLIPSKGNEAVIWTERRAVAADLTGSAVTVGFLLHSITADVSEVTAGGRGVRQ